MSRQRMIFLCVFFSLALAGCRKEPDHNGLNKLLENPLPAWVGNLTQVIISDIFTPPVSSRIYAYSTIAAYEALRPLYKDYPSYAGKLNGLATVPQPANVKQCDYRVAEVIAFSTVAQKLVFDGEAMRRMEETFLRQLDSLHMNAALKDSSISYGRLVGQHILAWCSSDGYLQRNSFPAYIVTKEAGSWQPTPPNYGDATETNWKTLRPMAMDSCSQFKPAPPFKYDTSRNSAFYKDAYQVYEAVKTPQPNDSAIAWYWDDNPNTSITDGHITYFQQKNSPGGHWMHIATSVARKEKFDAMKTASLVSKTAIAMYDAFISCWDAKFTYNYIRPETFINKYIDKDWVPLIQTPPFPEYPSGHSVASSSAATVLTEIVGDHYSFIDSAEVPYGRPHKSFESFFAAANQASLSRLYGGIHFMNAITNGQQEGRKVGALVLEKLK